MIGLVDARSDFRKQVNELPIRVDHVEPSKKVKRSVTKEADLSFSLQRKADGLILNCKLNTTYSDICSEAASMAILKTSLAMSQMASRMYRESFYTDRLAR